MIVASAVLIMAAAGLLLAGLVERSDPLYYGSIVTSGLAAFALIVGARRIAGADEDDDFDLGPPAAAEATPAPGRAGPAEFDDGDPPDEPGEQPVDEADAAVVARLSTAVYVIDGRPRYHLGQCLHLLGRDSESLPVREAVELGFTPCAQCEPDRSLLATTRRH
jgi:hypothetical protein